MNATFPADRPGPERLPDAGRSTTHDFLAESFPADDPADGSWFASAGFELPDDELPPGQRWSRYDEIGVLTGPEPVPGWVVTEDAAVETELGILKTGKEADVWLIDRAVPGRADRSCLLAAKRYRDAQHRQFHRDTGYTEGRRVRNSRDRRAMAKGTRHGRSVESGQWAVAEFDVLARLWSAGLPVPYPVQLDGTELLLEFVTGEDGEAAPRLAQTRPDAERLSSYWEQLRAAMQALAALGLAHGDLSPYNLLAAGDRLVVIDLPQVVDLVGNPSGPDFLARDCRNVCSWFTARGLPQDPDLLFGELISYAW
ncbi:RIO kinase 1 [Friedmanniella endophytica]|uniref:non-specific serine/threonine protein kinase n=1 Tax=Microlunatus kandeliicorticis TaxID=1759536 RepID=A0A7W3P543_9ACTN|nr:RIO1 family regulatory kinase/ATPase [Microlunatus kandeliicorticis]MBA8793500.1 RIO kinase 1 [Microlunatus kandeliicorticis]